MPIRHTMIAVMVLVALGPSAAGEERVLSHDRGEKTRHQSAVGYAHVIEYDAPEGQWWIRAVRIYGSQMGSGYDPEVTPFTVMVLGEDRAALTVTKAMYSRFPRKGFEWVDIALDEPIMVPKSFRISVDFSTDRRHAILVGITDSKRPRSSYGRPGEEPRPIDDTAEWMIRAILTDEPPVPDDRIELKVDDGRMLETVSLAERGHIVEFRRPTGKWWIHSVRIKGRRKGTTYEAAAVPFRVTIAKTTLDPIHEERSNYAVFGEKPAWGTVKLTSAVEAPSRFRVVVDFSPTTSRGVAVGVTAAKRTWSYTGLGKGTAKRFTKGAWMIRVVLSREPPVRPLSKVRGAGRDAYLDDLKSIEGTVRARFPGLESRRPDWRSVCAGWRSRFATAADDREHLLNVHRLLAVLGDSRTRVDKSTAGERVPAYDGLFGAGLWIAVEGDRRILRALMPKHDLALVLPPGSELIEIDGRPAAVVHEEVRRQVRTWIGWSSTHLLDSRLSWQFFPFGARQALPAKFRTPDGEVASVLLSRWGPEHREINRRAVTMPEGIEREKIAVSGWLAKRVGYLRILGGVNGDSRKKYFRCVNTLKGAAGIILDCRGMRDGNSRTASEMAGCFFATKTTSNGHGIEPTGPWQFEGPLVMLIDERLTGAAEEFVKMLTRTGRAVTVGRPTGGADGGIELHRAPSGLFSYRLTVKEGDRSGEGHPPDVHVPYTAGLLAEGRDPTLFVARNVLDHILAGRPARRVIEAWGTTLSAFPTSCPDAARQVANRLR